VNSTRRRRQILVAAIVLVIIGGVAWTRSGGPTPDKIAADPSGKTIENYKLVALDGSTATFDKYRGKPLVVNFWQTGCAPCRQEMPAFEKVFRQVGSAVHIVGVDGGDSLKDTADYVRQVGVTYDIVRDPGNDYVAGKDIVVWPTTMFVSPEGKILITRVGAMTADELSSQIKSAFG
jgi:thiol-disulfide isomerase/thioredoxin